MSIFTKIGCFIIGWNSDILTSCGEASKHQFRKLISAVLIMAGLWSTIGYCFAGNYMDISSIYGRLGVAIAFAAVIILIERVIILTVGKNWWMALTRGLLALCMALLGATIFDQLFFRNDIQQEISMRREDMVSEITQKRLAIYDADITRVQHELDSLSNFNDALYKEIAANPTTTVTTVSSRTENRGYDSEGKPIIVNFRDIQKTVVPNPRIEQAQNNDKQIASYNLQIDKIRQDKKEVHDKVIKEIQSRPAGFLEELKATYNVVTESTISFIFYIIMFIFLISLELFVLTIKMGDNKCDYDLVVEHQLQHRKEVLDRTAESLKAD